MKFSGFTSLQHLISVKKVIMVEFEQECRLQSEHDKTLETRTICATTEQVCLCDRGRGDHKTRRLLINTRNRNYKVYTEQRVNDTDQMPPIRKRT